MITKQKVQAVLRKAGYDKATWERSGMIRGWGEWSEGYEVKQRENKITVQHVMPRFGRGDTGARMRGCLEEYKQALEKAGINVVLETSAMLTINQSLAQPEGNET
jgi:ABC-type transport system substrate-binding protein